MRHKLHEMNQEQVAWSRRGLQVLVGSPFRIKQIQDGKEGLRCPFCKTKMTPIVSPNNNLNCNACEGLLFPKN